MFNCIRVSNCTEISERRGTAISKTYKEEDNFLFLLVNQKKRKKKKEKEVTLFRIIIITWFYSFIPLNVEQDG